jgi:hypothetical protein
MIIYLRSFKLESADDIIKGVRKLVNIDDLHKVVTIAKSRIEGLVNLQFCVDDEVQMLPEHHSRKPYAAVGKIVKINPKKFKVAFEGYGTWNIPKTMVMASKKEAVSS